jgi:hypothetical protein
MHNIRHLSQQNNINDTHLPIERILTRKDQTAFGIGIINLDGFAIHGVNTVY